MTIIKVHMKGRQRRPSWHEIGARKAEDLGSSPSECQIFHWFRCVLSSVLPLRSVGRSNFDKGLNNLITLFEKRHILMRTAVLYIYI